MKPASFDWRVLGASVAGSGHRRIGRGCDDAHAYRRLDDGTLVLAVADGAGSASRSADGAARAVQAVLESAETALNGRELPGDEAGWQLILEALLREARAAVETLTLSEAQKADAGEAEPPS
ncbi:MAG: protein phosphatase 2C domain-containing protein, partial [Dehalococcoidia bacterium]